MLWFRHYTSFIINVSNKLENVSWNTLKIHFTMPMYFCQQQKYIIYLKILSPNMQKNYLEMILDSSLFLRFEVC